METEPVRGEGDSGDDVCIWLHPSDPSLSTIIGTDSKTGVAVYDLTGKELFFREDGATGMVDLRYDFPLGDERISIVGAGNLAFNRIVLYEVDPTKRNLVPVSARAIEPGLSIYGTCMYRSAETDEYYAIVTSKKGEVEQWRLFGNEEGKVEAELARSFTLNPEGPDPDYTVEGCVADDELGRLYLAQEDAGRIWRVGAEPTDSAGHPVLVDRPEEEGGHMVPDTEGLAIYHASDGTGYLLASNQGNYTYNVYRREGDNEHVMTFRISGSESIDTATSDDSIEVISAPLGERFPEGLLVVEDGDNTHPGNSGHDNYKLVLWKSIANLASPPLSVDTSTRPRQAEVGAVGVQLAEDPFQDSD